MWVVVGLLAVAGCTPSGPGREPAGRPEAGGDAVDATRDGSVAAGGSAASGPEAPEVPALAAEVDRLPAGRVRLITDGAVHEVAVRLATDPAARRRGLMGVEAVPEGVGMLFVYDTPRQGGFWMKDTLVALDIAFVDAGGRVVGVEEMTPCTAEPCVVYEPPTAYTTALEVAGGWLGELGVGVGDRLEVVDAPAG